MSNKITCTCGHSWNKSSSSKKDMRICHICGKDNTMKNGGWLDAYDDEMQLGGYVYPTNYVPQAENGIEGTMGGLTDKGFNYNGAWGGTMQMGGSMPGSVGFTYARTKGIPSNGPYAKKTMASAQNGKEVEYKELPEITVVGSKDKQTRDFYNNLIDKFSEGEPASAKNPFIDARVMGQYLGVMNMGKEYGFPKVKSETKSGIYKNARGHYNPLTETIYANDVPTWVSEIAHHVQMKDNIVGKGLQWLGNDLIEYIKQPIASIKGEKLPSPYKKEGTVEHEAHSIIQPMLEERAMKDYEKYRDSELAKSREKRFLYENRNLQNGGEMKFYQEGLDWTPKNISRDGSEVPQAQAGFRGLGPITPDDVSRFFDLFSIPQKAVTKLVTGKYQTPSEAMNIKNPVGAFAVDAILDPTNLVGGAAASKIGKVAKSATKASKVAKPAVSSAVKNVVNKTKNLEDLQAAKKFAKDYGYKLPENLERIAQSDELTNRTVRGLMNRHNTFVRGVSTNWSDGRQRSLDDLSDLGIDYFKNPKQAAEYMATHIPGYTGYGRFGLEPGESALYLSNSIPTAEGYTYGQGYIAKVKRPTDFSSTNRQDWIKANDFDVSLDFKGSPHNQGIVKNDYIRRFPTSLRELLATTGDPNKFTKLKQVLEEKEKLYEKLANESWAKYNNKIGKLDYQTDAIARKNSLSDLPVLRDKPNYFDNLKQDYLFTMRDLSQSYYDILPYRDAVKGIFGDSDVWKAVGKNLFGKVDPFSHYAIKGNPGTKVLELLNLKEISPEIWENTSRLHTNKYSDKLTRKEEGGEIKKDDMGYWNPENWGEPVEINSNQITMQGVYEPLLGISDTGDTQIMYPGEDYKFKGKKVTEYPVKKNGGWLDRYN